MTQIRPGVYRLGETVEVTGNFYDSSGFAMNANEATISFRKPLPDNSLVGPFVVPAVTGSVFFEFNPDIIGTWKVRLECQSPKSAVIESKFEVVPHKF